MHGHQHGCGLRCEYGYEATTFLEKLGYGTFGVQKLINIYGIFLNSFRHNLCLF